MSTRDPLPDVDAAAGIVRNADGKIVIWSPPQPDPEIPDIAAIRARVKSRGASVLDRAEALALCDALDAALNDDLRLYHGRAYAEYLKGRIVATERRAVAAEEQHLLVVQRANEFSLALDRQVELRERDKARADAAEAELAVQEDRTTAIIDKLMAAEENLSFAQQRAADNGLRAEIGERKVIDLVAEVRDLKARITAALAWFADTDCTWTYRVEMARRALTEGTGP